MTTLTKEQVATRLGISVRTLDRMRSSNKFPRPILQARRSAPVMWDKVTIDHYALRSYAVSPVPVEDGLVVVAVDLDGNANQWIEYRAGRMMSAHALAFTITGSGLSLYYSNLLNCYGAQDMDVFSILSVVCFPAAELDWRDRVPHAEIISVIDSYLAATAN